MSAKVWCVAWRERLTGGRVGPKEWCATLNGAVPSKDAFSDETACGFAVVMRIDSAKRQPTCEDCKRVKAEATRR